jgi:hypothetical protein
VHTGFVEKTMKNITFSVDEYLLMRAKEKAVKEHRSLNELFRFWLEAWLRQDRKGDEYEILMDDLSSVCEAGGHYSREELNER